MTEEMKDNMKQDKDAAARLFAKCGFRNKLDINFKHDWIRRLEMLEFLFLYELTLRDFIRLVSLPTQST
jgi:hypothetical protein